MMKTHILYIPDEDYEDLKLIAQIADLKITDLLNSFPENVLYIYRDICNKDYDKFEKLSINLGLIATRQKNQEN